MLRNLVTLCLITASAALIGSQAIGMWQDAHTFYVHGAGIRAGTSCWGDAKICTGGNFKCEDGILTFDDADLIGRCVVNSDPAPLIRVKP